MRRIAYLISMIFLIVGVGAQRVAAQPVREDFNQYLKKIERSNKDIADEKKSIKEKTWMKRGDIYLDLARAYLYSTYSGMDAQTFALLNGKPDEQVQAEVNGTQYLKWRMPHVDIYFDAAHAFKFLIVTDPITKEHPLIAAREAFEKAYDLDVKGKKHKKIVEHLMLVHDMMANEGVNYYFANEMQRAAVMMDQAVSMSDSKYLNVVDTVTYYSAGLIHLKIKKYDKAAYYFKKALDNGYTLNGQLYCTYYETTKAAGKIEDGRQILESAVEKYPQEKCLMLSLVDYYMSQDKDPNLVMPYLDRAIKLSPDFPVLHFIHGVVLEKLEKPEEAKKAYKKAIEVDPNFADAYYNLATMSYNEGVAIQNEGMNLTRARQNEYDAYMKRASESFRSAIPLAEKALEIDPNHEASFSLLKTLYFRFRQENDMKEKYEALTGTKI